MFLIAAKYVALHSKPNDLYIYTTTSYNANVLTAAYNTITVDIVPADVFYSIISN